MGEKTVYLIKGEIEIPVEQLPELNDAERRSYLEAFIVNTLDFGTGDGFNLVSDALDNLTTEALLIRARSVMQMVSTDPVMREKFVTGNRYLAISEEWARRAAAGGSGQIVAWQYAEQSRILLGEARAAMDAATDQASAMRAAAKFGSAISRAFGPIPYVLAIAEGAYEGVPDVAAKGIFAGLAGAAGVAVVTYMIGGAAVLAGLATGPFIAAAVGIAAVGYLAGKFGEFIWEEGLGDAFWSALDSLGLKDAVEDSFASMSDALKRFLPASWTADDSESEVDVQVVTSGSVTTRNADNVIVGNEGANEIVMGYGRNVAYGHGGYDIYDVIIGSVSGNQVIVDSDGEGELRVNGLSVGPFRATGHNVAWSLDGQFVMRRVYREGQTYLVLNKLGFESQIIINGWNDGDLGIVFPELEGEQPAFPITHPGSDLSDLIDPSQDGASGAFHMASGASGAVHVVGGAGRDMLFGAVGDMDDIIVGGLGSDIINGRGGNDKIDGESDNDFISNFGDESVVHGGHGDDVIAANLDFSFSYNVFNNRVPFDENVIWRDLQQYFGWVGADGFSLGEDGSLRATPQLDLGASFSYSGASVADGWSYSFWSTGDSFFQLKYFGPGADPEGEDPGYGLIFSGESLNEFVSGVSIYGDAGNDTITGSSANDFLDGGADDDSIVGGTGDDVLLGGDGQDQLAGGTGNDLLDGGGDIDNIYGEAGNDVIVGGGGDDLIWGDNHEQAANQAGGDDVIEGNEGNDQLSGQGGNDALDGGIGDDLLVGGDGDDRLVGGEGADQLQAGAGHDFLDGGNGDDIMFGQEGDDVLSGGDGTDELQGNDGHDKLDGGLGGDLLFGQAGNDFLLGGVGEDELQGGDGNDVLNGGDQNDRLFGQAGNDVLRGEAGNDTLRGDVGDDILLGEAGADHMGGGDGNDLLEGGADGDQLWGEAGDDRLRGGAGDDYLDGDDVAVPIALHGQDFLDGGEGNDTLHGQGNDDIVRGGAGDDFVYGDDGGGLNVGNDMVYGDEGRDFVHGGAGNDQLFGGEGDDALVGGEGDDVLDGGTGRNQYQFERGFGDDMIVLGLDSNDVLFFRDGIAMDELIFARQSDDLLISMESGDSVLIKGYFLGSTDVRIQTDDQRVLWRQQIESGWMYGTPVRGGADADQLTGTDGNDRFYGRGGADVLIGLEGNDLLDGGEGEDTLTDGTGSDNMVGGQDNDTFHFVSDGMNGSDVAHGGTGDDTYYVSAGSGMDIIQGLDASDSGNDLIHLVGITMDMVSNFQIDGTTLWVMVANGNGTPNATIANAIRLEGFLANSRHKVRFADGTELTTDDFQTQWQTGTEGDDVLTGSFAPDSIAGAAGNDAISGLGGNDSLDGGNGDDVIDGGEGNDALYDGNGTDVVSGGNGSDRFYVTVDDHADRFIGGAGDDSYYVRHNYSWSVWRPVMNSSEIEEEEDGGIDTIYSNYHDVYLGANIENAVITPPNYWWPSAPNRVIGNALNNVIQVGTSSGHDQEYIIDGGAGNDTLIGGSTRDTYVVDSLGDVIIDQAFGDSVDTVQASIDYSIEGREELENLRLTGSAIYGTGNNDHNVIEGQLVDAVNHLAGLGGDDTYFVTRKDIVIEQAGGGTDTVIIAGWDEQTTSSMWFSVSDYQNVENLRMNNVSTYGPNGSIVLRANLQGDAGDNLLTGNMYANEIHGGAGNDLIRGNHFLAESNSSTQVNEADTLYGEDGHDTIHAAIYGADVHGGRGDDVLHGTGGGTAYGSRAGSDNFFYGAGDGTDRIVSVNGNYDTDRVIFGEGIVATETTWGREGNNLVIQLATGASDRLIIEGYWRDDWENPGQTLLVKTIDEFVFADGTIRRGTLEQLQVDNDVPVAHYFTYGTTLRVDEPFSLALPEGAFTDDGILTYSLDGPEWLHIDPQTGTISGIPPMDAEFVNFYIVATDQYGEWTSMYHSLPTIALIEGTAADDVLTGTMRGEELIGMGGNDRLIGGGGPDVLSGGVGDDTYVIDNDGATIIELTGEGFDTVESSLYSYAADKNVERIVLVEGAGGYVAHGNVGSQELVGNSLDNHLDGGEGADEMRGGAGNDIYQVENTGDVIIELAGEGTDSVYTTVSTTLSANVEDGYLDSEGNLSLTGNALANKLYGNEDGNVLDGGAGNDTLEGFGGDDTYHVDSNSDWVIEQEDGGIDTIVRSSGSQFQLANHVENLRLTSSGQATGNGLDNVIEGGDLANTLLGLGGNDTLHGRGGNDQLTGGVGNDQLIGGTGDDRYVFDASSGSDVINNVDGGFDGVFFTNGITRERLSFSRDGDDLLITVDAGQTPAVRVLNHFLGGDAAIDYVQPDGGFYLTTAEINQIVAGGGTGGQYDQVIDGTAAGEQLVGSSGKDLIKGLAGDDELFGMAGNDTLQGGDGNDYLAGGNGSGTGSGDDRLEGGAGADTLSGEEGANTLIGGAGNDSYVYGGGQDTIDNVEGGYDGVFFNDGITAEDMAFARDGDDLVITVGGNTNATVRVTDHFLGGDNAVDFVQPDTGNMLDTAAINALVGGGGNPGGGGNEGNDADYPNVVTGTASGEQLLGTSGRDLVRGLAGDDTLFGFGGDDKFEGGEGNDYLSGGNGSFSGSGNDILIGGNGGDTLVGEDGSDMLIGGAGDDDYYYSAASGSDTIDNVGGGTDWVFMNGIASNRLSFHQDGDDLLIRVDASAAMQIRVLKHFLGGDFAISYVQPGSGNAIPASQIPSRLTPLPQGVMAVMASSSQPLRMSDNAVAMEALSNGRVSQAVPTRGAVSPGVQRQAAVMATLAEMQGTAQPSSRPVVTGGGSRPIRTESVHAPVVTAGSSAPRQSISTLWEGKDHSQPSRPQALNDEHRAIPFDANDRVLQSSARQASELDALVAAMASFRSHEGISIATPVHDQSHQMLFSIPLT